jgi:hypothetical protein
MAIDTPEKRQSIVGIPGPASTPGVTPLATPDQEWRQEVGHSYSGILVGAPAVSQINTEDRRRSTLDILATVRILPIPNSDVDTGDRVQMYLYRGLVVGVAPAAGPEAGSHTLLGVGR